MARRRTFAEDAAREAPRTRPHAVGRGRDAARCRCGLLARDSQRGAPGAAEECAAKRDCCFAAAARAVAGSPDRAAAASVAGSVERSSSRSGSRGPVRAQAARGPADEDRSGRATSPSLPNDRSRPRKREPPPAPCCQSRRLRPLLVRDRCGRGNREWSPEPRAGWWRSERSGRCSQAKLGWRHMVRAYPAVAHLPAVVRPGPQLEGPGLLSFPRWHHLAGPFRSAVPADAEDLASAAPWSVFRGRRRSSGDRSSRGL